MLDLMEPASLLGVLQPGQPLKLRQAVLTNMSIKDILLKFEVCLVLCRLRLHRNNMRRQVKHRAFYFVLVVVVVSCLCTQNPLLMLKLVQFVAGGNFTLGFPKSDQYEIKLLKERHAQCPEAVEELKKFNDRAKLSELAGMHMRLFLDMFIGKPGACSCDVYSCV